MSTGIEWTGHTWNPIVGCSVVSAGCTNCYAMKLAGTRKRHSPQYRGLTKQTTAGPVWNGKVRLLASALEKPKKRNKPTVWFVNSMGDLFHENISLTDIKRVFAVMVDCPQHQFQVLTKRSERLAELAPKLDWPDNVWMGVSVENEAVKGRIDHLRKVPAKIRFLSCEPLIGPLPNLDLEGIHWVIAGGESGKGYRPIEPDWVRDIRDQCQAAKVAFFFKQWGGRTSKANGKKLDDREWMEFPMDMTPYEKKATTMTAKQRKILESLATRVKELIEKAEAGRVDAYVQAGDKLIEAKKTVKQNKRKWGEWLAEQGIPHRTANRAMQYAKNPEKYREDRINDALAKREKTRKSGQMSGEKQALLKIVRDATDSELEEIYRLIAESKSLERFRDMIPEKYRVRRAA